MGYDSSSTCSRNSFVPRISNVKSVFPSYGPKEGATGGTNLTLVCCRQSAPSLETLLTERVLAALLEDLVTYWKVPDLQLPKRRRRLQRLARALFVRRFDEDAKSAHPEPVETEVGSPHNVVVGEEYRRTLLESLRERSHASVPTQEQI